MSIGGVFAKDIARPIEGVIKADAHRKALTECEDYERDVLYPLASRNLDLDLDDGVLVNYLRFGKALVTVAAIEKKRGDVEGWTWPKNPLGPRGA
jgi:hypothetical protein